MGVTTEKWKSRDTYPDVTAAAAHRHHAAMVPHSKIHVARVWRHIHSNGLERNKNQINSSTKHVPALSRRQKVNLTIN